MQEVGGDDDGIGPARGEVGILVAPAIDAGWGVAGGADGVGVFERGEKPRIAIVRAFERVAARREIL